MSNVEKPWKPPLYSDVVRFYRLQAELQGLNLKLPKESNREERPTVKESTSRKQKGSAESVLLAALST